MDHGQLRMVADPCQWVCAASLLNACGQAVKFCRRERPMPPLRLGLALTATCACQGVETLADFPRGFPALFDTTITSTAFSHHVAKPRLADGARPMAARLIGDRTRTVLGVTRERTFAAFRPLVSQDGRAFAIHEALRAVFPGRFKAVKPAAGARHATMDGLCDAPTPGVLTPDTHQGAGGCARAGLPEGLLVPCRSRLPRFGLSASRAGGARLRAPPGQSGEESTGHRSVPGGWHTPAGAPEQAPPRAPRPVADTSARRAFRAVAGRWTAALPAVDRPLDLFPHARVLPGDALASATRPPREALASRDRARARGLPVASREIVGHSACL